jgi:glutamate/tyrosine decarboxylase-like PLP-dependent enzyme
MTPEEMRRLGHRVVDEVVDRWMTLRKGPAWEGGTRRELEPLLGEPAPEAGRDADEVVDRALLDVLPRAGRIDHPRFFAFIPSSPTWPSILGDYLATGFNIFQGTWLESAGPSQLELVVMDWFREWLSLPASGGGVLTSGGSAANLIALVTARETASNPERATVYLSDQGHSSLERAARIMGLPRENLRKVPTDASFRMEMEALARMVAADEAEGMVPLCICGNAGATNTGAIDPLAEMGEFARGRSIWFHVDGAYGGFAVLTAEGKEALRGIELADSVTLDPHKWFFQPYETGCLLVRETKILEDAFRILPEYLQDAALGEEHVNFADRGVQLTRRFRALKVWMSVQTLGLGAFREAIGGSLKLAREAETFILTSSTIEMLCPASLGVVCFRFNPPDASLSPEELEELNMAIQDEVVGAGLAMMSSTRLRGTFSLRLCIMNYQSTRADVMEVLEAIQAVGARLLRESRGGLGRGSGKEA